VLFWIVRPEVKVGAISGFADDYFPANTSRWRAGVAARGAREYFYRRGSRADP